MVAKQTALIALVFAFAQEKPPPPVSKELFQARKKVLEELTKMRESMAKKGMKAEVADCDSIMQKVWSPEKNMSQNGASVPYPGDKVYGEILAAWGELGTTLAGICKDAHANLKDKAELEQADLFAGWFATWPEIVKGITHLNRRRKFCKLSPVTQDWSGSLGGYLHGRYLRLNANDPSVAGLGAHDENPKLPGATTEGAEAGRAILGTGSPEIVVDSWLGSRFHRDPVFNATCSRVAFGGLPGGWWACPSAGGGGGRALADIVTYPGDGDTEIQTDFAGEAPDPFPKGMTRSGTLIVVQCLRGQPKKPSWKLLDPDGKEVTTVTLDTNPICFVAKDSLKGQTKYTVEIVGDKGFKHTFSFTTR